MGGGVWHVGKCGSVAAGWTEGWPESRALHDELAEHVHGLVRSLEARRKGEMFPNEMMDTLRDDFGDRVVTRAADQIATEVGGGIQQSRQLYTRRGSVLSPTAAAFAASTVNPAVSTARPHTFFGHKI